MLLSDVLKRENNNLDLVRLILAGMVIYYHAPVFINPNGEIDLVKRLIGFDGSGYIAVQCFFVISGLLVFNSLLTKQSVISYIISRFFRLVPGLAFVSIATVVIGYFFTNISMQQYVDVALEYVRRTLSLNIQFEITEVSFAIPEIPYPNQMFFQHGMNGSLWTIPYEVKMYAIVLAIYIISKTTNCKYIIPSLLISLVMMFLFGIYIFNGGAAPGLVFSFCFGAIMAYYKKYINLNYITILSMLSLFWAIENEIIFRFVVISGSALFSIWLSTTKLVRLIKLKHDISYGVYIWGWPVEMLFGYFFPSLGYHQFIIGSIVLTMLVAYVQCVCIEEPCINFGKRINSYILKSIVQKS